MASSEHGTAEKFLVTDQGAEGVGGFILHGLRLEDGLFWDNRKNRYCPDAMTDPGHNDSVTNQESSPNSGTPLGTMTTG